MVYNKKKMIKTENSQKGYFIKEFGRTILSKVNKRNIPVLHANVCP